MLRPARDLRPDGGRRRRLVLVALGVVLAHVLLLGGLLAGRHEAGGPGGAGGGGVPGADRPAVPPALVTRTLAVPDAAGPLPAATLQAQALAPALPPPDPVPPAGKPTDPVRTPSLPASRVAAASAVPESAGRPQAQAETSPPRAPAPEPAARASASASASASTSTSTAAGVEAPMRPEGEASVDASGSASAAASASTAAKGAAPPPAEAVPVYATRLPPAFTLAYELRRGGFAGTGELVWQPGPPYVLRLEGRVPILGTVITQTSQGTRDAQGLAPLRFTDRRIRRAEQAANFQRERGLISFSGPSTTYPLVAGVQDRLSWMLQLAGIAEAAPARLAGEPVSMLVVSARGDADVWSFRAVGRESLQLDDRPLQAVKLLREPRRPHDTRVEVWLAPDAHHLPVRARMTDNNGEAFELVLRSLPGHLRQ